MIVNYSHWMFILQDTVNTIVNYSLNMLMVQVTVVTILNYSHNMFIVQATDHLKPDFAPLLNYFLSPI